jgi:hypothetical protein
MSHRTSPSLQPSLPGAPSPSPAGLSGAHAATPAMTETATNDTLQYRRMARRACSTRANSIERGAGKRDATLRAKVRRRSHAT